MRKYLNIHLISFAFATVLIMLVFYLDTISSNGKPLIFFDIVITLLIFLSFIIVLGIILLVTLKKRVSIMMLLIIIYFNLLTFIILLFSFKIHNSLMYYITIIICTFNVMLLLIFNIGTLKNFKQKV